jgi:hypothetical protein
MHNWTLKATKTKVGYPSCVLFGFEVDLHGTRLVDKNLDPVHRMVPPTNLPELRSTLGVFVQSSRFIPRYSRIVAPLTALTRSANGKPAPFIWDDITQHAYDHVRNLLLDDIHLSPADYRLPFHGCGDASNDGKSFGLNQYNDLPPGTAFTVMTHSASSTTVLLTDSKLPHTIPHNDQSRTTKLGLTPIANAHPSTLRPTLFSGVLLNVASTPSRHRTPSTPTATTFPLNGSTSVTKVPSPLSPSNSSLTSPGFIPTSPDPKTSSTTASADTPFSAHASSPRSVSPRLSPSSSITCPTPFGTYPSSVSSPRPIPNALCNKSKHGAGPPTPSTLTPSPIGALHPPTSP